MARAPAMIDSALAQRIDDHVRAWNVAVEATLETQSSVVAFGTRSGLPVVLKVVRQAGDEWRSGEALAAFGGRGAARVYEHACGAVLMERLRPGTPLVSLALDGRDDEATEILANVIGRMSAPDPPGAPFPTVEEWGRGFERYLASGDAQVPRGLAEQAQGTFLDLCASQRATRLLHGDLQHYNVLFDDERGWLAIDPKGVVGEVEYEIGAALRNPGERPDLFAAPARIERRARRYADSLGLDAGRVLAWAFAQAVLSATWWWEDGFPIDADNPSLLLAHAIRPMAGWGSRRRDARADVA